MIIKDIQDIQTGQTRAEDCYSRRIGCRGILLYPPQPGTRMVFSYTTDNQGNQKSGCLLTSTITGFQENSREIIVTTLNSRYVLIKESVAEHVSCIFD